MQSRSYFLSGKNKFQPLYGLLLLIVTSIFSSVSYAANYTATAGQNAQAVTFTGVDLSQCSSSTIFTVTCPSTSYIEPTWALPSGMGPCISLLFNQSTSNSNVYTGTLQNVTYAANQSLSFATTWGGGTYTLSFTGTTPSTGTNLIKSYTSTTDSSGNFVLTFTPSSTYSVTQSQPLYLELSSGAIATTSNPPGNQMVWGSNIANLTGVFTTQIPNVYAIYNAWDNSESVTAGQTYTLNMAPSGKDPIVVSNVLLGVTPPPNLIKSYTSTIDSSGNFVLTFTPSSTYSVTQSQPLYLELSSGAVATTSNPPGNQMVWGSNIANLTGVFTTSVPNVYAIYNAWDNNESVTAGQTYTLNMAPNGKEPIVVTNLALGVPLNQLQNLPKQVTTITKPKFVPIGSVPNLRVGYVQVSGEQSADLINPELIQSCNIIVFAFATVNAEYNSSYDLIGSFTIPSNVSPSIINEIEYVMKNSSEDTIFLYSFGGANQFPSVVNSANVTEIVEGVTGQIEYINTSTTQYGKITGVDLDLENGVTINTIAALTTSFQQSKLSDGTQLIVSWAPQLVSTVEGTNISTTSSSVTNLGLSSGGYNNQYGDVLIQKSAIPQYIFVQCYNTGNFGYIDNNISGSNLSPITEQNPEILTAAVDALNEYFISNNIEGVNIAVGLPANRGSGGPLNPNTIFSLLPNGLAYTSLSDTYIYEDVIINVKNQLNVISTDYPVSANSASVVNGIMVWSLNNDSNPDLYQDLSAPAGGFCTAIFGAPVLPIESPVPYITLSINNFDFNMYNGGGVSVTLIIGDNYYCFGYPLPNGMGSRPIGFGETGKWCSISAVDQPPLNLESNNESGQLDLLAMENYKNGTIECNILVNYYSDTSTYIGTTTLKTGKLSDCSLLIGGDNTIQIGVWSNEDGASDAGAIILISEASYTGSNVSPNVISTGFGWGNGANSSFVSGQNSSFQKLVEQTLSEEETPFESFLSLEGTFNATDTNTFSQGIGVGGSTVPQQLSASNFPGTSLLSDSAVIKVNADFVDYYSSTSSDTTNAAVYKINIKGVPVPGLDLFYNGTNGFRYVLTLDETDDTILNANNGSAPAGSNEFYAYPLCGFEYVSGSDTTLLTANEINFYFVGYPEDTLTVVEDCYVFAEGKRKIIAQKTITLPKAPSTFPTSLGQAIGGYAGYTIGTTNIKAITMDSNLSNSLTPSLISLTNGVCLSPIGIYLLSEQSGFTSANVLDITDSGYNSIYPVVMGNNNAYSVVTGDPNNQENPFAVIWPSSEHLKKTNNHMQYEQGSITINDNGFINYIVSSPQTSSTSGTIYYANNGAMNVTSNYQCTISITANAPNIANGGSDPFSPWSLNTPSLTNINPLGNGTITPNYTLDKPVDKTYAVWITLPQGSNYQQLIDDTDTGINSNSRYNLRNLEQGVSMVLSGNISSPNVFATTTTTFPTSIANSANYKLPPKGLYSSKLYDLQFNTYGNHSLLSAKNALKDFATDTGNNTYAQLALMNGAFCPIYALMGEYKYQSSAGAVAVVPNTNPAIPQGSNNVIFLPPTGRAEYWLTDMYVIDGKDAPTTPTFAAIAGKSFFVPEMVLFDTIFTWSSYGGGVFVNMEPTFAGFSNDALVVASNIEPIENYSPLSFMLVNHGTGTNSVGTAFTSDFLERFGVFYGSTNTVQNQYASWFTDLLVDYDSSDTMKWNSAQPGTNFQKDDNGMIIYAEGSNDFTGVSHNVGGDQGQKYAFPYLWTTTLPIYTAPSGASTSDNPIIY